MEGGVWLGRAKVTAGGGCHVDPAVPASLVGEGLGGQGTPEG